MAQRISRAKRTVSRGRRRSSRRRAHGDAGAVPRLQRGLLRRRRPRRRGDPADPAAGGAWWTTPRSHGLLALMLLHHARRRSRTRPDGSIVPLAEQDRSQWDTELIAEGIVIVQAALARDQLGEYQAQAAIAALHADARACRGDRLGPDRGVVRRAAPVRRHADRPAQPRGRGRRGRRRARRAGGAGRGRRATSRGARRSPRTSTRRTATSSSRPASTPTPPATHPTSPSATTRRARPRDSTSTCSTTADLGSLGRCPTRQLATEQERRCHSLAQSRPPGVFDARGDDQGRAETTSEPRVVTDASAHIATTGSSSARTRPTTSSSGPRG